MEGEGEEVGHWRRRVLRAVAVLLVAIGLSPVLTGYGSAALAQDQPGADDPAPMLPPGLGGDGVLPFRSGSDGRLEAASEQASTTIDGRIVTSTGRESGAHVNITPADEAPVQWRLDDSGAALWDGSATDYVVQSDPTGVAVMGVLDAASPPTLPFDLDVSSGLTLNPDAEDGSIDIVDRDGLAVGVIETPWAVDAKGQQIPTHYTLRGRRLTQHLDVPETAVFPIVADPKFTWGIVTGTLYFNKSETKDFSDVSTLSAACGFLLPMPAGPILVAFCAAYWATWVSVAIIARNHGKCVKWKVGNTYTVPQIMVYSGGYCTK